MEDTMKKVLQVMEKREEKMNELEEQNWKLTTQMQKSKSQDLELMENVCPSKWPMSLVVRWLEKEGFKEYIDAFSFEEVDGAKLLAVPNEDFLDEWDVKKSHRWVM